MASFNNAEAVQNQASQQIIHGNINFYGEDEFSRRRQQQKSGENVTVERTNDFSFRDPAGVCLGQAPYINPRLFIGRTSELSLMNAILKPGNDSQESRRLVLGGQGGVGKTQLAIAYVNRYRRHYQSVFWLNAASKTMVEESYQSIAEQLFGTQGSAQSMNYVRRWLSDNRNTRWLAIFDNYDDPDSYNIEDCYPLAAHGTIIVTTRRPDRVSGEAIQVKTMDHSEDSLEILATRSQRAEAWTDPYAKQLAARLGGLPLALATAGAYLRTSTMTFERYLREYDGRWNVDPHRPLKLPEYQGRTLYTTWDLSYDRLRGEDSAAAELLKLLAYFDNQNVWYQLFNPRAFNRLPAILCQVLANEDRFNSAMRTLMDYCFVQSQNSKMVWSIHYCVHDWTLAALNTNIDTRLYWYAFDCVVALTKKEDWDNFAHLSYAQVAAHAMRLVQGRFWYNDLVREIVPDQLEGALTIARLLNLQDHHLAAEAMYQRTLAGNEKAFGPGHMLTLLTVNNLGALYFRQGQLRQAEQMYHRALAGCEMSLGPEHPVTLGTLNDVGDLYHTQGKLSEAEQLYQRALSGQEKEHGPAHRATLKTVGNLGNLYLAQRRLDKAEQMYRRVLDEHEILLGPEHMVTLITINNLASLYWNQGKLEEAEQTYQRALAECEKALGPDHQLPIDIVEKLGSLYRKHGKLAEAEPMYRRLLASKTKALGPGHKDTLFAAALLNEVTSKPVQTSALRRFRAKFRRSRIQSGQE